MKIDSLKDLQKLFRLCRQEGVVAFELDGIKFNIDPHISTQKQPKAKQQAPRTESQVFVPGGITEDMQIPTDGLTDEQILFYSSQGHTDSEQ